MTASTIDQASSEPAKLAPGTVLVLTIMILSTFIVVLNELMMGVAIPRLMVDLGITPTMGQWLTTGYMLTMAVIIPTTGFMMERLQLRTVFVIAMSAFTAGTLVAIVAPGFEMLLVGRIIQAVGTAIIMPMVFTSVTMLVPASRRGQTMALLVVATSVAPSVGPAISGLILTYFSWRWLFIFILPISVLGLVIGAMQIRLVSEVRKVPLDALSVILAAVGFSSLVYGLSSIGESATGHALVAPWISLTVGAIGIGLFVFRQIALQRTDTALLNMKPFTVPDFRTAVLVMLGLMIPAIGVGLLLPVVLQISHGLDTLQAGLFMAPSGITIGVVSAIAGRIYDRVGPRPLIIPGALLDAAALYALSTMGPGTSIWLLMATYIAVVAGQAMMWSPLFTLALGSLDKHLLPHGSSIVNTIQQLAGAAGIAILFSVMAAVTAGQVAGGTEIAAATSKGAQTAFLVGSGIVLAGLVVALFVRKPTNAARTAVHLH